MIRRGEKRRQIGEEKKEGGVGKNKGERESMIKKRRLHQPTTGIRKKGKRVEGSIAASRRKKRGINW